MVGIRGHFATADSHWLKKVDLGEGELGSETDIAQGYPILHHIEDTSQNLKDRRLRSGSVDG